MQLMCADGSISRDEKKFLSKAARELDVHVDNWKGLLKEVLNDEVPLYPIHNRDKAVATLKALIVMSRADGKVDPKEKSFVVQFAKSIGVSKTEWKHILSDIDPDNLFEPFFQTKGNIVVIQDNFDKLDLFEKVASENGAFVNTTDLRQFIDRTATADAIVCFHAAEDKDETVTRCGMLLDKCDDKLVCVLTRFQGCQVKYLLEIGLKRCIIEPIYARDITELFSST